MGIFKGSRYTKSPLYDRNGSRIFKIRVRKQFVTNQARVHTFVEGDTLDGLANQYYGDAQLWWVILEANKNYRSELDIKAGDALFIPSQEEVR